MEKHKYLSNFDCFSLRSNALFGLLDCDCTPILFINIGMFSDHCQKSSNTSFKSKKWKIEFAKQMCKGLIHE